MSVSSSELPACVQTHTEGAELRITLSGRWRITELRPSWSQVRPSTPLQNVRVELDRVEGWDSALVLYVYEVDRWCRRHGIPCDLTALPASLQKGVAQWVQAGAASAPAERSEGLLTAIGLAVQDLGAKTAAIATFVGECVLSALYLLRRPHKFRWRDCLEEMQKCGAMALPIVGLISLLVGLIMAYQSAVLMRQFGADIYVADAVGLVMVREMGAMMTAIILAGRTGAAFAAQIGNMKANEEIDALETLGIRPVDFLVMPRMLALGLMMPLLSLYANGLGILGGMAVAATMLEIPPAAYWVETQTAIDLSDINSGLIKASTFGLLVGLAGCLRGLQADRSAAGVGRAATSAVVTALLLIIIFDAIYAVVFNLLGI